MGKHITFFHGGGSQEDYDADGKLVASLKMKLGSEYAIHYPYLPEMDAPDLGRREQIRHEINASKDNVILVGHSLGASMMLVCLSEFKVKKKISGIFLLATPFWNGDEDWVEAFKLKNNFQERLDKTTPLHFYHCCDDEEVPFSHFNIYKEKLPWAKFHEVPFGGHQFNNDLTVVADEIRLLASKSM
jgi:uncharacterized protein